MRACVCVYGVSMQGEVRLGVGRGVESFTVFASLRRGCNSLAAAAGAGPLGLVLHACWHICVCVLKILLLLRHRTLPAVHLAEECGTPGCACVCMLHACSWRPCTRRLHKGVSKGTNMEASSRAFCRRAEQHSSPARPSCPVWPAKSKAWHASTRPPCKHSTKKNVCRAHP
jgi:hypothetical protein